MEKGSLNDTISGQLPDASQKAYNVAQAVRKSILVGLLLLVGGNGILVWSEQYIPSGLAALILAIIPIWMVLLEWIFVTRKRPTFTTIAGIGMGILGVGLLSGVDRSVLLDNTREGSTVFFYAAMLMLAGFSWASGSLYSRTIHSPASLLKLVSIQMLAGGIVLLLYAAIIGEWQRFSLTGLSGRSIISLIYLIIFASRSAWRAASASNAPGRRCRRDPRRPRRTAQ